MAEHPAGYGTKNYRPWDHSKSVRRSQTFESHVGVTILVVASVHSFHHYILEGSVSVSTCDCQFSMSDNKFE